MTLTKSDLIVVEGEPRVTCRRLAEALGFTAVRSLHRLIRANEDELRDFGDVFHSEVKNPSRKGGRPQLVFKLNERQAIAITMWAATPQARAARRLIVEVFYAWRQDNAMPALPDSGYELPGGEAQMRQISADRLIELLQAENQLLRSGLTPPKCKRRPVTPISDPERQEILRLIRADLSLAQISRVTGRSQSAISLMRSGMRVIEGGK